MKYGLTFTLAVCLIATLACPSASTPYGKAGEVALTVTDVLHTGATTVDTLRVNGTITVDEEKEALHDMDALNSLDIAFGACIQAAHLNKASKASVYISCAVDFETAVKSSALLTSFHVTSRTAETTVMSIATAVVSALDDGIKVIEALPPPKP